MTKSPSVAGSPLQKRKKKPNSSINLQKYPHLKGAKILVVEDNELNSRLFKDLLESHGASVKVSITVNSAIELINSETKFDVVLLDIQLPERPGFDLLDYIIKHEVPVKCIVCTAFMADLSFSARFATYGIVDVLSKPISVDRFFSTINKSIIDGRYVCDKFNSKKLIYTEEEAKRLLDRSVIELRKKISEISLDFASENFEKDIKYIMSTIKDIRKIYNKHEEGNQKITSWNYLLSFFKSRATVGVDQAVSEAAKIAVKSALGG